MHKCLLNTPIDRYHHVMKNLCSPLSPKHKITEVIKRIALAILAPLAYPILGLISLVSCKSKKDNKNSSKDKGESNPKVFFVRFLNISKPNPTLSDFSKAVNEDISDLNKSYQKGACLYTPSCIQPLPAFDPRHDDGSVIGVDYPFAFLIESGVKLHYWSLTDMDRNMNREAHEEQLKAGVKKYQPKGFHNLFSVWNTVHFTGVGAFIKKLNVIAEAVKAKKDHYFTAGGKKKNLMRLKKNHNEASITYNPMKDVRGILIRNTPNDIKLATEFKANYKDAKGQFVFKKVFLAYQNSEGKLVRLK